MHGCCVSATRTGQPRNFKLNRAQQDLERTQRQRNIVSEGAAASGHDLRCGARFFINCITREGTLSVQVAHDQRSAEEIFRIQCTACWKTCHRDAQRRARNLARQRPPDCVSELDTEYRVETAADPNAGRGLTIHNLHCSEVARWPRDVSETLASLRAAVPPEGEIFLESTPERRRRHLL